MKKIFAFILLAAIAVATSSCTKDNSCEKPEVPLGTLTANGVTSALTYGAQNLMSSAPGGSIFLLVFEAGEKSLGLMVAVAGEVTVLPAGIYTRAVPDHVFDGYYINDDGSEPTEIEGGDMTITLSGGVYTITMEGTDSEGRAISLSYTGTLYYGSQEGSGSGQITNSNGDTGAFDGAFGFCITPFGVTRPIYLISLSDDGDDMGDITLFADGHFPGHIPAGTYAYGTDETPGTFYIANDEITGSMTISYQNGVYTISVTCSDGEDNATINYTGTIGVMYLGRFLLG